MPGGELHGDAAAEATPEQQRLANRYTGCGHGPVDDGLRVLHTDTFAGSARRATAPAIGEGAEGPMRTQPSRDLGHPANMLVSPAKPDREAGSNARRLRQPSAQGFAVGGLDRDLLCRVPEMRPRRGPPDGPRRPENEPVLGLCDDCQASGPSRCRCSCCLENHGRGPPIAPAPARSASRPRPLRLGPPPVMAERALAG